MFKFAKEDAVKILGRLDRLAGTIQQKHASLGLPFDEAKAIVNDLDRVADMVHIESLGEASFHAHQAKVLEHDSDESYMTTFNAPQAPHQQDSDEPYMGMFKDDQSSAVQTGKSTTNRPLT